ncbi:hypothetical protein ABZU25_26910, partial [Micromonospora sp. NPDC005215]
MYGWTDPMDPNGASRRAERPTDEPTWLHDRPEPRSAYLFGDDPDQPGDEWHREQPPTGWQSAPETPGALGDAHPAARPDHRPEHEPTEGWHDSRPAGATTDGWRGSAPAGTSSDGWRGSSP